MTTDPFKPALKVLLVDDDPDTRQVVSVIVEKAGHVLFATSSGTAALSLLNREKVDVIILDIMMPEMDGLSILETIRTTSEAPILMLTAISNPGIMEQCYLMGANDYIVKPFTRGKLIDRIERLAAKSKPADEKPAAAWATRFWLDKKNHLLIKHGTAVDLTDLETIIMSRLMESAEIEVSDTELYLAGWGPTPASVHTVHALVEKTIRDIQYKIEDDPEMPKILISTRDGFTFSPGETVI